MTATRQQIAGHNAHGHRSKTPGITGVNDASDPNLRFGSGGDTPGSVGVNDRSDPNPERMLQNRVCNIVPFDLEKLDRLFRSVGIAKAFQQHTHIQWQDYTESSLLNFIYAAMPWKGKPGYVEVMTANQATIDAAADKEALRIADVFFSKKCGEGPTSAMKYLESLAELRATYLHFVQQIYNDAREINQEIVENTETVIRGLKAVKAGSKLFLAPASLVTGPIGASIYLGYEISIAIAENWEKGADAIVIGDGTYNDGGVAKEVIEEGIEKVGEAMGEAVKRSVLAGGKHSDRVNELRKLVQKYSTAMEGKKGGKLAKLTSRVRARSADIAKLQKAAARQPLNVMGKLASRVNFLFVAIDMAEAFSELRQLAEEQFGSAD